MLFLTCNDVLSEVSLPSHSININVHVISIYLTSVYLSSTDHPLTDRQVGRESELILVSRRLTQHTELFSSATYYASISTSLTVFHHTENISKIAPPQNTSSNTLRRQSSEFLGSPICQYFLTISLLGSNKNVISMLFNVFETLIWNVWNFSFIIILCYFYFSLIIMIDILIENSINRFNNSLYKVL